jgi:hypothetical protein
MWDMRVENVMNEGLGGGGGLGDRRREGREKYVKKTEESAQWHKAHRRTHTESRIAQNMQQGDLWII